MPYPEAEHISQIVAEAQTIVIVQADNPDADSLGSALALEQILGDIGKTPMMYCGMDMPSYLRYLAGWDRVNRDLPNKFDASIVVDASTMTLLEKIKDSGQLPWLSNRPCLVLDHHAEVSNLIPFATVAINDASKSSTGEIIYHLGKQLAWPMSQSALSHIMTSILGDTQGLSNQLTHASTYRVMAELTDAGVDRPALEEARREATKMEQEIFRYKGRLIDRTELLADGRLALVTIPQAEISQYSPLYNPAPLIQGDMLQTRGILVSIVLKQYDDGKATAAIRCNNGAPVGADLADHFGGGGHPYASGFKVVPGKQHYRPFNEIKSECIRYATELLDNLKKEPQNEPTDETVQYAHQTN